MSGRDRWGQEWKAHPCFSQKTWLARFHREGQQGGGEQVGLQEANGEQDKRDEPIEMGPVGARGGKAKGRRGSSSYGEAAEKGRKMREVKGNLEGLIKVTPMGKAHLRTGNTNNLRTHEAQHRDCRALRAKTQDVILVSETRLHTKEDMYNA